MYLCYTKPTQCYAFVVFELHNYTNLHKKSYNMTRQEMKKLLSAKSIMEIATETGLSRTSVYAWLQGDRHNPEIENCVLKKVAETLEIKKQLTERIQNALS